MSNKTRINTNVSTLQGNTLAEVLIPLDKLNTSSENLPHRTKRILDNLVKQYTSSMTDYVYQRNRLMLTELKSNIVNTNRIKHPVERKKSITALNKQIKQFNYSIGFHKLLNNLWNITWNSGVEQAKREISQIEKRGKEKVLFNNSDNNLVEFADKELKKINTNLNKTEKEVNKNKKVPRTEKDNIANIRKQNKEIADLDKQINKLDNKLADKNIDSATKKRLEAQRNRLLQTRNIVVKENSELITDLDLRISGRTKALEQAKLRQTKLLEDKRILEANAITENPIVTTDFGQNYISKRNGVLAKSYEEQYQQEVINLIGQYTDNKITEEQLFNRLSGTPPFGVNDKGIRDNEAYKNVPHNVSQRIGRIARTEVVAAFNLAKLDKFREQGIEEVEWISKLESSSCGLCAGRDGTIYRIDDLLSQTAVDRFPSRSEKDSWEYVIIPTHPNCFPAGTKITLDNGNLKNIEDILIGDSVFTSTNGMKSNVVIDTMKREYTGHLIKLTLEDGRTIKTTPDHPIWGGNAFYPAEIFEKGDYLYISETMDRVVQGGINNIKSENKTIQNNCSVNWNESNEYIKGLRLFGNFQINRNVKENSKRKRFINQRRLFEKSIINYRNIKKIQVICQLNKKNINFVESENKQQSGLSKNLLEQREISREETKTNYSHGKCDETSQFKILDWKKISRTSRKNEKQQSNESIRNSSKNERFFDKKNNARFLSNKKYKVFKKWEKRRHKQYFFSFYMGSEFCKNTKLFKSRLEIRKQTISFINWKLLSSRFLLTKTKFICGNKRLLERRCERKISVIPTRIPRRKDCAYRAEEVSIPKEGFSELTTLRVIKKEIIQFNECVYNFTVENNEVYFANGILVHNCKCYFKPVDKDNDDDYDNKKRGKVKKDLTNNDLLKTTGLVVAAGTVGAISLGLLYLGLMQNRSKFRINKKSIQQVEQKVSQVLNNQNVDEQVKQEIVDNILKQEVPNVPRQEVIRQLQNIPREIMEEMDEIEKIPIDLRPIVNLPELAEVLNETQFNFVNKQTEKIETNLEARTDSNATSMFEPNQNIVVTSRNVATEANKQTAIVNQLLSRESLNEINNIQIQAQDVLSILANNPDDPDTLARAVNIVYAIQNNYITTASINNIGLKHIQSNLALIRDELILKLRDQYIIDAVDQPINLETKDILKATRPYRQVQDSFDNSQRVRQKVDSELPDKLTLLEQAKNRLLELPVVNQVYKDYQKDSVKEFSKWVVSKKNSQKVSPAYQLNNYKNNILSQIENTLNAGIPINKTQYEEYMRQLYNINNDVIEKSKTFSADADFLINDILKEIPDIEDVQKRGGNQWRLVYQQAQLYKQYQNLYNEISDKTLELTIKMRNIQVNESGGFNINMYTLAEFSRKRGSKNKNRKLNGSQKEKAAYKQYDKAAQAKVKATMEGFKKKPYLAGAALASGLVNVASAGAGAGGVTYGILTKNKNLAKRAAIGGIAGVGAGLTGSYLSGRKARESVGYYG